MKIKLKNYNLIIKPALPGEEYNIDLTDFNVVGFKGTPKYDKFYARSKTEITGGLTGFMYTISEEEGMNIQIALHDKLYQKLVQQARAQLPEGFVFYDDGIFLETTSENDFISDTSSVSVIESGIMHIIIFDEDDLEQKIINIRRVTRVVSGGRRMSFSVFLAAGDKKGSVGLGTGKAIDTSIAISKALRSAKKNMMKISSTKDMSILHEVTAKFGSSKVTMMPNKARGLVVGSAVRDILRLAGIKNVTSKVLSGSKNKLNIARATMKALAQLQK